MEHQLIAATGAVFTMKCINLATFPTILRPFATFATLRRACGHLRLLRRLTHFTCHTAPCGGKVPKVIIATCIHMVTTLQNISHTYNLTVGMSWRELGPLESVRVQS